MRAFAPPTDLPYELRSLLTLERGGRCELCGAPVGVGSLVQITSGAAYSVDDFRLLCQRRSDDSYARDNAGKRRSLIHLELITQDLKCPPPPNLPPDQLPWFLYACGLQQAVGPGAEDWAKVKDRRSKSEERLKRTRKDDAVEYLNNLDEAAVAGILKKIRNNLSVSYAQAALQGMKSLKESIPGISKDEEKVQEQHSPVENVFTLASTTESPDEASMRSQRDTDLPALTRWLLSWGFVSLDHYTTLVEFAERYGKLPENAPQYQQALRANATDHNVDVEKNSLLLQLLPYVTTNFGAYARAVETQARRSSRSGDRRDLSELLGPSATQLDDDSDALLKAVGVATSGKQEQILGPSTRKNPGKIHQDQQAR